MDRTDRILLDLLQRDARTPVRVLAETAGASTASVQRRLKRLRGDGTITGEVVQVDPKAAGYGVTAIVSVTLERDSPDRVDAFHRRAQTHDQVQHCYCVTGDADFVLVVIVRDIEDYDRFARSFLADANVRHYRSSIAVARVKASAFVPMDG